MSVSSEPGRRQATCELHRSVRRPDFQRIEAELIRPKSANKRKPGQNPPSLQGAATLHLRFLLAAAASAVCVAASAVCMAAS